MQDEMNDLQYTKPEDPDIVKVVRCKYCKHYDEWLGEKMCARGGYSHGVMRPNDFCSYGERKDCINEEKDKPGRVR